MPKNIIVMFAAAIASMYFLIGIWEKIGSRLDRLQARAARKEIYDLRDKVKSDEEWFKTNEAKAIFKRLDELDQEYRDIMWRHPEWFGVWDAQPKR